MTTPTTNTTTTELPICPECGNRYRTFEQEKAWAKANGKTFPFRSAAEWEWANRVGFKGMVQAIRVQHLHIPGAAEAAARILGALLEGGKAAATRGSV